MLKYEFLTILCFDGKAMSMSSRA